MSIKVLNNPEIATDDEYVEFVNDSGGALAHGDVVVMKLSNLLAASQKESANTTTTKYDDKILGVVHDPMALGVANGARGTYCRRGFHQITVPGAAITALTTSALYANGTAKTAAKATAAATILAGARIGFLTGVAKTSTASTTAYAFIDIK